MTTIDGHAADGDDEPVEQPAGEPDGRGREDAAGDAELGMAAQQIGRDVGGEADHRGHRQVDVAGEDHQHLAGGDDGEQAGVHRQRRQIGAAQHARVDGHHRQDHGRASPAAGPARGATTSGAASRRGRSTASASGDVRAASAGCGAAGVGHRVEHALLGRLGRRQLGGDPALAQHHDPVAHAQQLGQLRRDQDDGEALPGQVGDDRVHLGLGLHVDALGRLVEDQHARLGRQPLGRARPSADCRRTAS